MSAEAIKNAGQDPAPGVFTTTHWSVVLLAGREDSTRAAAALERLCRTYWYPLYAFARRSGLSPHDAQDSTQGFFEHLLEKSLISKADPARGRFRSFLLTSFRNHLGQERLKASAQKRGGGASILSLDDTTAEDRYQLEPADSLSPDRLFERRWAVTLIAAVLAQLETEWRRFSKHAQFEAMRPYLTGDQGEATYRELGGQLGVSEGAARIALHRLRQRYSDLFRAEVMQTVAGEVEFEEELQHICRVLSD